ncbi:MAG: Transcriptional regulator, TetR family [Firmicutes bacterium]|nr:Transcriptional regulator, TetR family [Bacillota bacterium]
MGAKTDTREKILNTAASLFQKNGYHATGLNEIIRESESPKGSLYYHFPNGKEELAIAAVTLAGSMIQEQIEEKLARDSDPAQAIKHYILDLADSFEEENPDNQVSLSLLALEIAPIRDSLRDACKQVFELCADTYYRKLITCGFPEEKAKEISSIIFVMIEGAMSVSLVRNDPVMLVAVAEQISILLNN